MAGFVILLAGGGIFSSTRLMSPSLLTGPESGFGCARKKAICAMRRRYERQFGKKKEWRVRRGLPVFEAEADCGAGRVTGTRVCAGSVCLAESSQPPIAREAARETARAAPMKNHSRFAYGYIKSGGPQADYERKEVRAAGRSPSTGFEGRGWAGRVAYKGKGEVRVNGKITLRRRARRDTRRLRVSRGKGHLRQGRSSCCRRRRRST